MLGGRGEDVFGGQTKANPKTLLPIQGGSVRLRGNMGDNTPRLSCLSITFTKKNDLFLSDGESKTL